MNLKIIGQNEGSLFCKATCYKISFVGILKSKKSIIFRKQMSYYQMLDGRGSNCERNNRQELGWAGLFRA